MTQIDKAEALRRIVLTGEQMAGASSSDVVDAIHRDVAALPTTTAQPAGADSELIARLDFFAAGGGSVAAICQRAKARIEALTAERDGLLEAQADKRRLAREIDVVLHGDEAASQASLCDLVQPAREMRAARAKAETEAATLRAEVERLRGALQAFKDFDDLPTMAKRPDVFELRVRQPILRALEEDGRDG